MSESARSRRQRRQKHYAERREIDGRLVATKAPVHGTSSTYINYGCRCRPCTKAQADVLRNWRKRRAS